MYVPRASILQRPLRDGARANEEQQDTVFAKEQARLAFKTQRLAAAEERMVGAFYGTIEDRRNAWGPAQREAEQLAAARAAVAAEQAQRDADWAAQPQRVVIDTRRPWTAAGATYYMTAEQEVAARRRAQKEASDVNRAIAQRRAAAEAQSRTAEQVALSATMVAEDTYFNLGAASERWIPPERRIKQRAAVPPQFAPAPPPYCCDEPAPSSRPSSTCSMRSESVYGSPRAAAPAARPTTAAAARRAQEGQGVAAALRYHEAPAVAPRAGSCSYGGGFMAGPAMGAGAPPARPQTAPPPRQQNSGVYPWSWAG